MKVGLQFVLVEEYFFGFFFDVRSTFKGRFRLILVITREQLCLKIIVIESRMHGDHEELKILFQNCLISSRFNRKLSYKKKEHLFIEKIS